MPIRTLAHAGIQLFPSVGKGNTIFEKFHVIKVICFYKIIWVGIMFPYTYKASWRELWKPFKSVEEAWVQIPAQSFNRSANLGKPLTIPFQTVT